MLNIGRTDGPLPQAHISIMVTIRFIFCCYTKILENDAYLVNKF